MRETRGNCRSETRTEFARKARRIGFSPKNPKSARSTSSKTGIFLSAANAARSAGCSQARGAMSVRMRMALASCPSSPFPFSWLFPFSWSFSVMAVHLLWSVRKDEPSALSGSTLPSSGKFQDVSAGRPALRAAPGPSPGLNLSRPRCQPKVLPVPPLCPAPHVPPAAPMRGSGAPVR